MKRALCNKKGMTLVEIIVAIAILGIMAAAFLTVFVSGYSVIFSMGRKTQAMNDKAQTYMDQIYDDYAAGISAAASDPDVTVDDTQTLNGMKVVKITVEYQDGRSVTLTSLVP
jgi:prepilin-type N-terminal cleavage/methylation domain-containing protein